MSTNLKYQNIGAFAYNLTILSRMSRAAKSYLKLGTPSDGTTGCLKHPLILIEFGITTLKAKGENSFKALENMVFCNFKLHANVVLYLLILLPLPHART